MTENQLVEGTNTVGSYRRRFQSLKKRDTLHGAGTFNRKNAKQAQWRITSTQNLQDNLQRIIIKNNRGYIVVHPEVRDTAWYPEAVSKSWYIALSRTLSGWFVIMSSELVPFNLPRIFFEHDEKDHSYLDFEKRVIGIFASNLRNRLITQKNIQRLPHQIDFIPNNELVGYVKRGIEAIESLKDKTAVTFDQNELLEKIIIDESEISKMIVTRLRRMFSVLSSIYKYNYNTEVLVGNTNGFEVSFQYEIVDRLIVRPDQQGEFLKSLYLQLKEFLLSGGKFEGDWGKLVIKNNELWMILDTENGKSQLNSKLKPTTNILINKN